MVIQGKRETTPGMGANPTKGTIISTDLERAATANANVTDNMTEPKCLSPRTSNQNQSKVLRDCPNGCPNHVALTTPPLQQPTPPFPVNAMAWLQLYVRETIDRRLWRKRIKEEEEQREE